MYFGGKERARTQSALAISMFVGAKEKLRDIRMRRRTTLHPSLRQLRALIARVKRQVPTVRTPSLILHAHDDDITGVRNALFLQDRLAGPRRTVLLDDCYHMITVDRQRDLVVRLSADYFAEIAGRAAKRVTSAAE